VAAVRSHLVRAVVCRELGDPESLAVEERPSPPIGADQLRLRVRACGVNYVDALFVAGRYQIRPEPPFVPGSEIAGDVIEVGSAVRGWTVGDRASASVGLGGFVDEAVVAAGACHPTPATLDDPRAATMGQSYSTAWFTLTRRTRLEPGEWVVALGAGGGVGLATLDVARALGARTLAVASSAEKLQRCIERGVHDVVNAGYEDVKSRVRMLTGGGADVVVDPVGGELSEAGLRSLREQGRLMVLGFASGEIPRLPANQVLLRNRHVIGVDWGAWALSRPREQRVLWGEVADAVTAGRLDPVAPTVLPLDRAAQALRDLLERRVVGKLCLVPEATA
jgi:NADPH:quinone reductase